MPDPWWRWIALALVAALAVVAIFYEEMHR
jgi:hypothetical protein